MRDFGERSDHSPSGADLDAWIAEHIMGGVVRCYSTDLDAVYTVIWAICGPQRCAPQQREQHRWRFGMSAYCAGVGYAISAVLYDEWTSGFEQYPTSFRGDADTPALAMCRAAKAWAEHHLPVDQHRVSTSRGHTWPYVATVLED